MMRRPRVRCTVSTNRRLSSVRKTALPLRGNNRATSERTAGYSVWLPACEPTRFPNGRFETIRSATPSAIGIARASPRQTTPSTPTRRRFSAVAAAHRASWSPPRTRPNGPRPTVAKSVPAPQKGSRTVDWSSIFANLAMTEAITGFVDAGARSSSPKRRVQYSPPISARQPPTSRTADCCPGRACGGASSGSMLTSHAPGSLCQPAAVSASRNSHLASPIGPTRNRTGAGKPASTPSSTAVTSAATAPSRSLGRGTAALWKYGTRARTDSGPSSSTVRPSPRRRSIVTPSRWRSSSAR